MNTTTCVFCKIVAGEIPSEKTEHANGSIVSFLDIHPKAPGHTLVVPQTHTEWFIDMPDEAYLLLMKTCRDIARTLKKEYGADYIHMSIVGKDVPHVHVHLIPRKLSDQSPL